MTPADAQESGLPAALPPLCARCSYLLSGLADDAACPECGLPDAVRCALRMPAGLTARRIAHARLGALVTVWGTALALLLYSTASVVALATMLFTGAGYSPYPSVVLLAGSIAGIASWIGLWWFAGLATGLPWIRRTLYLAVALAVLLRIALCIVPVGWMVFYLTGGGGAFLAIVWDLLPGPVWFIMEGVERLLPALGIIAAASIVVWLAREIGDEPFARQASQARWLMPLIIILFVAAASSLEAHFDTFTRIFLSIGLQALLAAFWIVLWLRVLHRFARLLRIVTAARP